ncbi:MAG: class I SAM-dependent rRNA methyltransferase [Bdellovibrionota bacterium]
MELELERAWQWREKSGLFSESEALRVFHGPGEGSGALAELAIDRFGEHYWVTDWGGYAKCAPAITAFLRGKRAQSAVVLLRPDKGIPATPQIILGKPPESRFTVSEAGARFRIQLLETKHPGLFLDHLPLRHWLRARARGWRVLNTFAYTGSLSVAAGLGGAAQVTTLDLSKPTVQWAEENWKENGLAASAADFVFGDVFDWLPRWKRQERRFECVILDPPSFSHGKKGNFSTAKDLQWLHAAALEVLAPQGILITSINSANVSWKKYEADVAAAAQGARVRLEVLGQIDLPETFPTVLGKSEERYLKGWIIRRR